eukprot:TRINITY_DN2377_c0_g1_i1.p1 TRINITY_DN2377_c0_g1~~TRINITY_DN2377_c0_g1_i1.p1  ORF type:complete len:193 (+),score=36.82 TRINITY_DN2377_c0_g1_i1:191-769(+)
MATSSSSKKNKLSHLLTDTTNAPPLLRPRRSCASYSSNESPGLGIASDKENEKKCNLSVSNSTSQEQQEEGFRTPQTVQTASNRDADTETFMNFKVYSKQRERILVRTCPPLGRTKPASRRNHRAEIEEASSNKSKGLSKSCSRKKLHRPKFSETLVREKPALPESFVQEQKAHFAEIDAFDLQEEEVSGDS